MSTRIYRIGDRLIEAPSIDVAVRVVVERTVECRVASQRDLIELRNLGVQIIKHTDKFEGPLVGIPLSDLKVAVTISPELPDVVRTAGEKYLQDAGDKADMEGLRAAVGAALLDNSVLDLITVRRT